MIVLNGSLLMKSLKDYIIPTFNSLRDFIGSDEAVILMLRANSRLFNHHDKLKESIEEVEKMGMDPESSSYSVALSILTATPLSKLSQKMEAYKRWGCSEDQVLTSFKIQPSVMSLSVEKIKAVMTFCVNEMGLEPSEVMRRYYLLMLSLNKRIVPRWSVYRELVSKGLVKEGVKWTHMFRMSENLFLDKYVNLYKKEAPSLLKLYHEKLEASK